jgi:hypothetical protein
MATPGFTAEQSLYRTAKGYHGYTGPSEMRANLRPALLHFVPWPPWGTGLDWSCYEICVLNRRCGANVLCQQACIGECTEYFPIYSPMFGS